MLDNSSKNTGHKMPKRFHLEVVLRPLIALIIVTIFALIILGYFEKIDSYIAVFFSAFLTVTGFTILAIGFLKK